MRTYPNRTGAVGPAGVGALFTAGMVVLTLAVQAWDGPIGLCNTLRSADELGVMLEDEREINLIRMERNAQVNIELATGRLSLAEAADLRSQINEHHHRMWGYLRARYPDAANDRERMARATFICIEPVAFRDPPRDPEMSVRLSAELMAMTGRAD